MHYLLRKKVDIESSKTEVRPLYRAVKENKEGVTRLLLENGANPNATSLVINGVSTEYKTPLEAACEGENSTIIKLLVLSSANVKDGYGQYFSYYLQYKNSDPQLNRELNAVELEVMMHKFSDFIVRSVQNKSPEEECFELKQILHKMELFNNVEYAEKILKIVDNGVIDIAISSVIKAREFYDYCKEIPEYPDKDLRVSLMQTMVAKVFECGGCGWCFECS